MNTTDKTKQEPKHHMQTVIKDAKKLLVKNERMAEWIRDIGVRYDICTKNILGEVCSNCNCK